MCAIITPFARSEEVRPNVVVLLSDDLGYQDIGCYNGPVKTRGKTSQAPGNFMTFPWTRAK